MVPNKIVLFTQNQSLAPHFFGSPQIFGLAMLLVSLKDCWEPHQRCLGATCDS